MAFIEFILLVSILVFCLYKWLTINFNYFKKIGIPYEKGYPIVGSFPGSFIAQENFFDTLIRFYMKNKGHKVHGLFQGRIPILSINDTELIKQITVKDFDHFVNHMTFIEPEDDALFGNSLVTLKEQKWKDMRSTLSPVFTGSKMRLMFQLITECCDQAIKVLSEKSRDSPNGFDLNMKDFFTRFTNDAIATSAFGLKINSISGENSEFYEMGKKVTSFDTVANIKFMLMANAKAVMRLLNLKLFDAKLTNYFMRTVLDTMKYRTENDIHRPDMIDMLMEARKSTEKSHNREWTDVEIVAQCFLFFFAGFETTSILMCWAANELMENPECQDKLFEEIQEIKKELNGEPLNYDALKKMKYMDMVVSETLRKWPAAVTTDRQCSKAYKLKVDDRTIDLNPGDVIWIPMSGLHYDPDFFPNPKQFDPERFNDENKGNINPFAYCPFGLGPRNCIGSRLALMEAKAILFYMLSEFKFEVSTKSCIPMTLDPKIFTLTPKGGFWVKMVARK